MASIGRVERRRLGFFQVLDYWLLIPMLFICILGLYVLDIVLQLNFPRGYPRNILVQVISIGMGMVAMLGISFLERSLFRLLGWMIYAVALFLQLLLPIFGSPEIAALTGSNAWLVLPGLGTFQPSELSKSGLCVVLAFLLEDIKLGRFKYWQGFLLHDCVYHLRVGREAALYLLDLVGRRHLRTVHLEQLLRTLSATANPGLLVPKL